MKEETKQRDVFLLGLKKQTAVCELPMEKATSESSVENLKELRSLSPKAPRN